MVGAKRQGFNRGFGFFTTAADTSAALEKYRNLLGQVSEQFEEESDQ